MAKIRTIIVDDELHARDSLKMLIQSNCPTIEIIGEANNVESAYLIIEELKPDLARCCKKNQLVPCKNVPKKCGLC